MVSSSGGIAEILGSVPAIRPFEIEWIEGMPVTAERAGRTRSRGSPPRPSGPRLPDHQGIRASAFPARNPARPGARHGERPGQRRRGTSPPWRDVPPGRAKIRSILPVRAWDWSRKASQSRLFLEAWRISSSSVNRSSGVRLSVGSAGIRTGRMRRKTRLTVVTRLSRKTGPWPGNIASSSSRVLGTRPG